MRKRQWSLADGKAVESIDLKVDRHSLGCRCLELTHIRIPRQALALGTAG
jgi:hypothetical protein